MKNRFQFIPVVSLCFVVAAPVFAQDQTQAPPPPPPKVCEEMNGFSDFDFWVGEWNVYAKNPQGQEGLAGTNSITKHYQNCLIKETWENTGGGGGFSINYFNPNTDEWRQVWVSPNLSIDYTGGLNEDGAMVLKGTIYYYANGNSFPFRGIWTPNEDGSVTQHFDQQNPETGEWQVWFEGRYVRKEDDPNTAE